MARYPVEMENKSNEDEAVIAIVTHGEELWGAERLRRILSDSGFKVLGVDAGEIQSTFQKKKPTMVIANLAGKILVILNFAKNSHVCVRRQLSPLVHLQMRIRSFP